jgi:hypothetical protein
MNKERILVIACGPFDYANLSKKELQDKYLFFIEEIKTEPKDIEIFISYILKKYATKKLVGVLGTHDGPESLVSAILAKELGLYNMDPEKAFVCEHKFYSRKAQQKIVPEAIPGFQLVPLNNIARDEIHLSYPFFVKPVKSAFSMLAKSISNFKTLQEFLPKVEKRLKITLPAFDILIKKYTDLTLGAHYIIAEELLHGDQVTVEAFSYNKRVTIMGITDSIMYPGSMSFERFEYPSKLPKNVQQKMNNIAESLIFGLELDFTLVNIEMMYNHKTESIHVIEINPRMSYQFADIFEKVDGSNSYAIQLELAQGLDPVYKKGNGEFGVAASFVLRLFEDKLVTRVPSEEEISEIQKQFPDALVVIKVKEGIMLSDLSQDEKSYRYAIINMGGKDWSDLYHRFELIKNQLKFEFSSLDLLDTANDRMNLTSKKY